MLFFNAVLALLLVSVSDARHDRRLIFRQLPGIPKAHAPESSTVPSPTGDRLPDLKTWYYFDQLIDHNSPEKGTFRQRYFFTAQFYEPGGPIILLNPGEQNAEQYNGYLTNTTITGQIAQANHGATVVLEHRFFGYSNPYPDLTDESLQLLNPEQAIADLAYFAQNAVLPMTNGSSVKAPHQAPWILVGGSYSGALVAWTMQSKPGIFWAGYSSSGVVEPISDFWTYFEPIRRYMPRNCSADVVRVISHMDEVLTCGNNSRIAAFKAQFGMENVTHLDDVASTMRYPIWTWLDPPSTSAFQGFCDALEVEDGVNAPERGWGLKHALLAWGKFMPGYLADCCRSQIDDDCLGTYDATLSTYTNTTIDNSLRSWQWLCCNFFGFWNDGAPIGHPSLASRLVTPAYGNRQCSYFFPRAFPDATSASPQADAINQKYGGWNINIPRLFFSNGKKDPWREASVSSDLNPRQSTPQMPIVVSNGKHCNDLIMANGDRDVSVQKVQKAGLRYISEWISEWHNTDVECPSSN